MNLRHFDIDESMWTLIEPILPADVARPQGGRPPLPNYQALCGILYRLHTGCQWRAIPERFGGASTLHRRFQQWVDSGVFEQVFEILVRFYDELKGIGWEWMSLDAAIVKAPKGGDDTGRNPTDRGKSGTKRHVLTDERGVPIAVETSAANVNDGQMVEATLDAIPARVSKDGRAPENLCMDKAYDSKKIDAAVEARGIEPHTRRRGEPPLLGPYEGKPRRWVVERTNSWHNRFRGLLVRWERKGKNYRGLVLLASGLIAFQQAIVGLA
jgi:putative transposase